MSRSNNTDLVNPAQRFFEWSGGNGTVTYYDRETKENIEVPLPFRFLVLDKVAQVGGGIDRNGQYEGFWSNAIRNTKTQPITVRSKSGVEAQGLYDQIKGTPGVKWITGLYIAYHDDDGTLIIGYLKIKGAALNAWIEFTKAHKNIYKGAFGITGSKKAKKGTNTYYEPVFEHFPKVSEESDKAAIELDVHLQEYLTAYFAREGVEVEYTGNGHAIESYGHSVEDYEDDALEAEAIAAEPTIAPDADDDIPF